MKLIIANTANNIYKVFMYQRQVSRNHFIYYKTCNSCQITL